MEYPCLLRRFCGYGKVNLSVQVLGAAAWTSEGVGSPWGAKRLDGQMAQEYHPWRERWLMRVARLPVNVGNLGEEKQRGTSEKGLAGDCV